MNIKVLSVIVVSVFILSNKFVLTAPLSQQILKEALVLYTQGEYERAKELLYKVLQIDGCNPIASTLLAKITHLANAKTLPKKIEPIFLKEIKRIEDIKETIRTFAVEATRTPPTRVALQDDITNTQLTEESQLLEICNLVKEGQLDEASTKLQRWFSEYPESKLAEVAFFTRAKILQEGGDKEGALKVFDELSKGQSKLRSWVHLERARINYENAKLNEALEDVSKTIQFIGEDKTLPYVAFKNFFETPTEVVAHAHLLKANIHKAKGEYTNAIVEYKAIVDNYNTSSVAAQATFSIADIYDNIKDVRDYAQAYQMYKFLVKRYPDSIFVERARFRMHHIEKNFL